MQKHLTPKSITALHCPQNQPGEASHFVVVFVSPLSFPPIQSPFMGPSEKSHQGLMCGLGGSCELFPFIRGCWDIKRAGGK